MKFYDVSHRSGDSRLDPRARLQLLYCTLLNTYCCL